MTINSEKLKFLRKRQGLSLRALADKTTVSARHLSRIEKGGVNPNGHTSSLLAKALGVSIDDLSKPPSQGDGVLSVPLGKVKKTAFIDRETALSMIQVELRYGISEQQQIELAPLFTAIVAELSLRDRREKLVLAREGFGAVEDNLSRHFGSFWPINARYEDIEGAERRSIEARDLVGEMIWGQEGRAYVYGNEEFDRFETNPFVGFLRKITAELGIFSKDLDGRKAISPSAVDGGFPGKSTVFLDEASKVLGRVPSIFDASWATTMMAFSALVEGHTRITEIPEDLLGEDRFPHRLEWLVSKCPKSKQEAIKRFHQDLLQSLPDPTSNAVESNDG